MAITMDHDVALVLATLGEHTEKWGYVPAQDIAAHLGFDVREVTTLLHDLERDGLAKGRHESDLPSVWIDPHVDC